MTSPEAGPSALMRVGSGAVSRGIGTPEDAMAARRFWIPAFSYPLSAFSLLGLVVGVGGGGVVAFDDGAALEGAEDLVTAGDNLVAVFEATQDFDVGGSGDAGGDGDEVDAKLAVG